jgi:hypothetical protein
MAQDLPHSLPKYLPDLDGLADRTPRVETDITVLFSRYSGPLDDDDLRSTGSQKPERKQDLVVATFNEFRRENILVYPEFAHEPTYVTKLSPLGLYMLRSRYILLTMEEVSTRRAVRQRRETCAVAITHECLPIVI